MPRRNFLLCHMAVLPHVVYRRYEGKERATLIAAVRVFRPSVVTLADGVKARTASGKRVSKWQEKRANGRKNHVAIRSASRRPETKSPDDLFASKKTSAGTTRMSIISRMPTMRPSRASGVRR